MEPQNYQAPQQLQSNQPQNAEDIKRRNKAKLTWGLILLIGPSALLILSILIYALANYLSGGSLGATGEIINIILYLAGIISTLTWLPGVIIGIVLLATRQKIY